MSYILDALRRAEADRERERGQVPGLHTQPLPGRERRPAHGPRRWLPWTAAGALLLAGIGVGSWWAGAPEEPAVVPPQVATAPSPVAAAPVTAPPPVASVPAPEPAASASPYLPPAPPPGVVAPAPQPAAPPAEVRVPRLAELPDRLRRELPALAISGSVYSEDPAGRFVIINGEVQREGAKLGADLVLDEIRPRELVLRFKGQRYRQPV